ncbi:MAG: MATE family efflux transporter [Candidatus Scalindua sp.]|nr:MAG: MATE family efflux transporter [Candidatus Scalindua sp.]
MNRSVKRYVSGPGGILELLVIAMPMVISQACETVMLFTDRLFLSHLSPTHMAASMSGGLTAFMCMTFFIGLTGYTTPLVAQYFGAGQEKKCAVVVTQAVIISGAAYPLMLASIPIGHWLFQIVGHSEEQQELAQIYFDILMLGTLLGIVRNSLNGFFCGIGKTRIVMVSSLITMTINVVVNYMLILGKGGFPVMGIRGAAIGTIIGSASGLMVVIVGYILYHRSHRKFEISGSLCFDWHIMKKLLRFGYPGGLEFFFNLLAFDLIVLLFHSYSLEVAASVTIALNWDLASFIPLIGVNIGVTSLVGRYMGAHLPDNADRTTQSGLILVSVYAVFMLGLFVLFPQPLVSLFLSEAEKAKDFAGLAEYMVRMIAVYVIADGFALVYSGALRGAGDTFWAMVISVSFHWLLAAEAVVMIRVLHLSPKISWTVVVFSIPLIATAFYLRYRSGKWRQLKVVGI